ncbi:leucyl/phenylalanyl-tRNA--protein transferase [Syntrophotalea acetylenivorans]|uniref:Leucyl/phenylalanyl-tRNA--protein transferase n=1 Tax=Syntrophotalea acetylenivorans TaxID=1842532 RepID=A0A1L3GPB2_9BACT|nr:leucyl/phenylalanyl-tRNA--protein transferase [Syntrophotalea acetylenivorans]APG27762.1 leucyl/phenylalanyl-tRNA--protein transferase [Syntrophotalea acetylenivorans]
MTIYRLTEQLVFPNPELADPEGLLAVGGDLSPHRLLLAYSLGIFPWFNEGEPPLWWCPDPRCVLFPSELKVSRSLGKLLRRNPFHITSNRSFAQVIDSCAALRQENGGTWITDEMRTAYCRLHEAGYAHSVEAWLDGNLVGGLYGVCLGRCFFGESMFFRVSNASKIAFATLVQHLRERGFVLVDCQLPSDHLASLGARTIPRSEFLQHLVEGDVAPGRPVSGPFPASFDG